MKKNNPEFYTASYIQLSFVSGGGSEVISFSTDEVEGKVEYQPGSSTELIASETGAAYSQGKKAPSRVIFTLLLQNDSSGETRVKYARLMNMTKPGEYYTCAAVFNFHSRLSSGLNGEGTPVDAGAYGIRPLLFSSCVVIRPDVTTDSNIENAGAGQEKVKIEVHEAVGSFEFPEIGDFDDRDFDPNDFLTVTV